MKKWLFIFFLFTTLAAAAQQDAAYKKFLQTTNEIAFADSLLIDSTYISIPPMDTFTVKKWFSNALSILNNNRLKKRDYFLIGKITYNENFDLLIVVESKERKIKDDMQVIYLISTKKNGDYITSLEVAVNGSKNKADFSTFSYFYKDNTLKRNTQFKLNDLNYADINIYHLTKSGRFLLAPNY